MEDINLYQSIVCNKNDGIQTNKNVLNIIKHLINTYSNENQHSKNMSRILSRRIYNEWKLLVESNFDKLELVINKNPYDKYDITIKVFDKLSVYEFKDLILDYLFPFVPPNLFINNIDASKFLHLTSERFRNQLKYVCDLDCLYCDSILCPNKWTPTSSIKTIINQIMLHRRYKCYAIIKLLTDAIKEKYLIKDIQIFEWLFNPALSFHLRND